MLSRGVPDSGDVAEILATGEGDQGAFGQMRGGLAVFTSTEVVAGVDGGRGEFTGLAAVRSVARAPGVAGLGAVSLGGEVAHGLEGIAPVTKVLDPVGEEFQFAGLDLGAVLFALEVFHLGRDLVDAAVETLDLGVQRIDEAPEQALAFVGELRAVRRDGAGQNVDGFLDPGKRLVLVPDLPVVELVGTRGRAEQGSLLASHCGLR